MNKRFLSLGLLVASMSFQAATASQHEDAVVRSLRAQLEREAQANAHHDGSNFRLQGANGVDLTIGGNLKSEYVRQHQTESFNKNLPDEWGYFKNRVEIDLGAQGHGVEMGARIQIGRAHV